jgi:hypothetical protein
LLDHAAIKWVGVGERLKRVQHRFFMGADMGRRICTFRTPRATLAWARVARPLDLLLTEAADRCPILLEHRLEDLQTRCDGDLHQLGLRIRPTAERKASDGRIDLVRLIGCARLSLHRGQLLARFFAVATTRLRQAVVRSRRSQMSTATGTSP